MTKAVDGNHDPAGRMLVNGVIGVKTAKKFVWQAGGKRFCAMHGHRFDIFGFVFGEELAEKVFAFFARLVRKFDRPQNNIARLINSLYSDFPLR